jgi:glucoamylase
MWPSPAVPADACWFHGSIRGFRVAKFRGSRQAFGAPGDEPRWTHANKDGVGTAYAVSSRLWFTLLDGIVTEVYCPTVDRAQLRDLQLLVTDGETFMHEERRHLKTETRYLAPPVLGYHVVNTDPDGRYSVEKTILSDPHYPCLLQRMKVETSDDWHKKLKVFVLCAPHLEVGGWHNNACIVDIAGRSVLAAEKKGTWLAVASTSPFVKLSCGYVGRSDGWTDLADNFRMDWEFDRADDGNVALIGEIENPFDEFTVGFSVADSLHNALTTLLQSLDIPFAEHEARFTDQWNRATRRLTPLQSVAGDGGKLYATSYSLLMAHEDKTFPGAMIASMSIPWGEAKGDEDRGGYHLVWTRDLVNSVMGLLAAGNTETPRRALIYLATSQRDDGGFAQNAWINGEPYWTGIQLDEVAFPILLARRLLREGALQGFDPYPMVLRGAAFLMRNGPATAQERWEEASGYSPSTLANNIAALICAACFARDRNDEATARFMEDYADFLEQHVEHWTVTTQGSLVPGISRHYIRIHPIDVRDPRPLEYPNEGALAIPNVPPGQRWRFPSKDIVDAGFLELVRYGIRRPDDPLVVDSVRVVDAVLKVETPFGPCWHRYNHDGYGQGPDGGAFVGWGVGRVWPLLTGERGHYEIAARGDASLYIQTLERFASTTGLIPEQVWDEPNRPDVKMYLGCPTGAARPLMWAHAEYIKLLRSTRDAQVFDRVREAAARYCQNRVVTKSLEIWKPNRQVERVAAGATLRVQAPRRFQLHWTADGWQTVHDTAATATALGVHFVDIPVARIQHAPIKFTFLWLTEGRWEGRDYAVEVVSDSVATGAR